MANNKMGLITKKVLILFCTVGLLSCTGQGIFSKNDAVNFMVAYFEKVKQNDFSLVESFYSERFYEATSRERWEEMFYAIHSVLGELISIELETWSVRAVATTAGSGRYFTLVYNNEYTNGNAREVIILFIPRGSDEPRIIAHNVTSDLFLGL